MLFNDLFRYEVWIRKHRRFKRLKVFYDEEEADNYASQFVDNPRIKEVLVTLTKRIVWWE